MVSDLRFTTRNNMKHGIRRLHLQSQSHRDVKMESLEPAGQTDFLVAQTLRPKSFLA